MHSPIQGGASGVPTRCPAGGGPAASASQFSSPSFTGSAPGPYLTGGVNGQGSGAYSVTGITYAPDGDVTGATDSVNGQWQYEYGALNRLLEACDPNCGSPATAAGYVYDRFGNRWRENALAGTIRSAAQLSFDANNHILGASYDASGDLLEDAGGNVYAYDAEHRITSANSGNIQYVYNAPSRSAAEAAGNGQRVDRNFRGKFRPGKLVGGVARLPVTRNSRRPAPKAGTGRFCGPPPPPRLSNSG